MVARKQAKLAKTTEKSLHRQIAVVTGAASGLGSAAAKIFKEEGAEVAFFDIDRAAVEEEANKFGGIPQYCDVTDPKSVDIAVANNRGPFWWY